MGPTTPVLESEGEGLAFTGTQTQVEYLDLRARGAGTLAAHTPYRDRDAADGVASVVVNTENAPSTVELA
jgi:hypothetical protein